jgi:hypothetical protein
MTGVRRRLPMRWNTWWKLVLLAGLVVALPRSVSACPSCADAVPLSNGGEEDEEMLVARAYNQSIYLMVGMPYLLLGGIGFLVYRGLRRRAASQQARNETPCYPSSPGVAL